MGTTDKVQATGQFTIVDETTNTTVMSFDLATLFPIRTGVPHKLYSDRHIVDTDGAVALATNGVTTIGGLLMRIIGSGTVTFKHNGNASGLEIEHGILLYGTFASPTIETTATTPLHVEYFVFE